MVIMVLFGKQYPVGMEFYLIGYMLCFESEIILWCYFLHSQNARVQESSIRSGSGYCITAIFALYAGIFELYWLEDHRLQEGNASNRKSKIISLNQKLRFLSRHFELLMLLNQKDEKRDNLLAGMTDLS